MGPMIYPQATPAPNQPQQPVAGQPQPAQPGLVDGRTQEEAAQSLLTMPMTPVQQIMQEEGKGKFAGKMLLNMLSGGLLSPVLFDGLGEKQQKYATDKASYDAQQKQLDLQAAFEPHLANLADGVDGPEDAVSRAILTSSLGSIDKVEYAMTGNKPGLKPEYVTVNNNGQKYMVDKNNPNAPGIPLTTPDGQPIREALPQWQVDNIGAFDRMAPRLQELDEMERNGMRLNRETMTALRKYESEDASGRFLTAFGWQKFLENELTPAERQYILAAEDAGMITLRDESGAAISASEILRQMNQYIMFSEYDDKTLKNQREARNRKAQTLMTGVPDYIKADRQADLDYVTNFDGTIQPAPAPADVANSGGNDKLPPMTSAQMATYLRLLETNPDQAGRMIELIEKIAAEGQ